MIGTDGEGKVSGDDCTEAECSDMRGKLYLWIFSFSTALYRVFILQYEYPMRLLSIRMYKGNVRMGI
jgi:hypothetical protein